VTKLEGTCGDPAAAHAAVLARRDDARSVQHHAKQVRSRADGSHAAAVQRSEREYARAF
jgi:hypothetical protein